MPNSSDGMILLIMDRMMINGNPPGKLTQEPGNHNINLISTIAFNKGPNRWKKILLWVFINTIA